jgi:hypothetical protein
MANYQVILTRAEGNFMVKVLMIKKNDLITNQAKQSFFSRGIWKRWSEEGLGYTDIRQINKLFRGNNTFNVT